MAAVDALLLDDEGHRFGNFPNYYSFHEVSDRLDLITDELVEKWLGEGPFTTSPFTICDVGSNDGTLTRALHEKVVAIAEKMGQLSLPSFPRLVSTLGLELDHTLVERANKGPNDGGRLTFKSIDATDSEAVNDIARPFTGGTGRFSLVTCFSTTMWIHVTFGDEVFCRFLHHIARLGDRLVIEPQPWRCYRQAATRLRRLGRPALVCYDQVAARSDKVIEDFIQRTICGEAVEHAGPGSGDAAGETPSRQGQRATCTELCESAGSWKRKVLLFTAPHSANLGHNYDTTRVSSTERLA
jgi:hypothetical protein